MTAYPRVVRNVEVRRRPDDVAADMADEIESAEGKLGTEGRVLVRASGTEPLVRVMVEAPTAEIAESVADGLVEAVRRRFS